MYTIQALWTAARHEIGAKFVVCNNRSYQLLKLNVQQYWRERGFADHAFPGSFDLGDPVIRFDELAREHGRARPRGSRRPTRSRRRSREALAHDGPFLIDLRAAPGSARPRRGRGEPPPGRRHEGVHS